MTSGNGDGEFLSFSLSDGTAASSPDSLIRWCEANPQEGAQHLLTGDFAKWLTEWGRDDLVQVATDALAHGRDDAEKLSLFIGFSKIADYFQRSLTRRFTFLLVGRTGVGKSSTINTLLGKEVAEIGDTVPVTSEVVSYDTDILSIPCRVVDTPGLSDGSRMDDDYLVRMHKAVGKPGWNCVWFVTPLTETRVRDNEISAINHITEAFGPEIWSRSVVVLSFAVYLSVPERFQRQMTVRPGPLRKAIADAVGGEPTRPVGSQIAAGIPFVAVTNEQDTTPDGAHSLGHLYVETLDRMSAAGFGPLFLALMGRAAGPAGPAPRESAARTCTRLRLTSTFPRPARRDPPPGSLSARTCTRLRLTSTFPRPSSSTSRCTTGTRTWSPIRSTKVTGYRPEPGRPRSNCLGRDDCREECRKRNRQSGEGHRASHQEAVRWLITPCQLPG